MMKLTRILMPAVALLLAGALLLQGCAPTGSGSSGDESARVSEEDRTEAPSDEVLDYLAAVALDGFEFGEAPSGAYKWTKDVRVQVTGAPTAGDLESVETVIGELNELIESIRIHQVDAGGDIVIYYGPDSEFKRQVSDYTPGNRGYFSVRYSARQEIQSAKILISTHVEKSARAHLLREELTQSMGFFRDSWDDKESIFYQGWTTTTEYTDMDREIIRLLYSPKVKPGMSRHQVEAALASR